ncbi:MAG: DUF3267 domain-containing protein [Pseudoxanthomonas sp.]
MKFAIGMPPQAPCALNEPKKLVHSYKVLSLQSAALGGLILVPLFAWLLWEATGINPVKAWFDVPPYQFLGTIFGLIVIHELAHLLTFPQLGLGSRSYLGFLPSYMIPYASHQGPVRRWHHVFTAITPFVLISIVPTILAFFHPTSLPGMLIGFILLNAFGSGGDLIIATRALWWTQPGDYVQGEWYGQCVVSPENEETI